MAFTMPNFPILTPEQANPFHAALMTALSTYGKGVQAAYAPQMAQADIFSKQFAPLAQIASSPLALAMLPDQQKQMAAMISQLLQQSGAGSQGSSGGSNMLASLFSGQNQGQPSSMPQGNNPMAGAPASGNPSYASWVNGAPGSGVGQGMGAQPSNPNLPPPNLQQGAMQTSTGKYQEQIHPPATAYTTPQGAMVTPTANVVDQAQHTINAASGLKALVPELQKDSQEFLTPGTNLKYYKSYFANLLNKAGAEEIGNKLSNDVNMAGRYSTFQSEVMRATDLMKLIYPNANTQELFNRYAEMLQIHSGDNAKTYKDRLDKIMNDITTQTLPIARKAMGSEGGYPLNSPNPSGNTSQDYGSQTITMKGPDGKVWHVPQGKAQRFMDNGFIRYGE